MKKLIELSLSVSVLFGASLAHAVGTGQIGSGGLKQELPKGFEEKKLDDISLIVRSNEKSDGNFMISKELLNERTILTFEEGSTETSIRVICTDKSIVDCKKFRFISASKVTFFRSLPDDSQKLNNVNIYAEEYGAVSKAEAEVILKTTSHTVAHDETSGGYFNLSRYVIYMSRIDGVPEILPIALPISSLLDVVAIPFDAVANAQESNMKETLAGDLNKVSLESVKVSFDVEQFGIFSDHLYRSISKPLN